MCCLPPGDRSEQADDLGYYDEDDLSTCDNRTLIFGVIIVILIMAIVALSVLMCVLVIHYR